MKSRIIVCAVAASLGLGSLSFAQGYDRDRGDNNRQGYQQREPDRHDNDQHGYQDRSNDRGQGNYDRHDRDHRDGMGNRGDHYYYGARGPEWHRGGHIPPQYRGHQYVVEDWRGHHLRQPPRGYQWVQVGGDYVLVAIATGIIAQLLLNQ